MLTPISRQLCGADLALTQSARVLSHPDQSMTPKRSEWPSHLEGATLHLVAAPPIQRTLAAQFPGDIASFRSAGRQVLLRRATRGTRRLSASETSLRAEGYRITERQINAENWLSYYAEKEQKNFHIREQITDGHQSWNAPSTWFWHATMTPKSGPWLAITVLTPVL